MFIREIGRVVAVDSFRVIIELDENIKGTQKSGYHDIYEVAKINSYIIIPVGSEKIVCLITRVKMFEENELEKMYGEIKFAKSKRHIVATMLGTIVNEDYNEGVYNYPVLDNPVWYVIKEDLDIIFDIKNGCEPSNISICTDYYLPIGKVSNFSDYEARINPDKFFNKHAAILGSTGSGKSCTVASILQSLFKYEYKPKPENQPEKPLKLKSGTIIIFDINGEYKKAFEGLSNINSFTIADDGVRVPYWFMNYDDFEFLFEPAQGTQAPILKKALGNLKNNISVNGNDYKDFEITCLEKLLENCENINRSEINKIVYHDLQTLLSFSIVSETPYLSEKLTQLHKEKSKLAEDKPPSKWVNGNIDINIIKEVVICLRNTISNVRTKESSKLESIDKPVYFNFKDLVEKGIDSAIDGSNVSKGKYLEYTSSLKLRLSSYLSDIRKSEPLMISEDNIDKSLAEFLKYVLGEVLVEDKAHIFNDYKKQAANTSHKDKSQIIILDMSLIPYELVETLTGLIGRLVLEFTQRICKVEGYKDKRGHYPIAIVLEEAHNYIPELDKRDKKSIAKTIFERIAREGRKFGVSLIVSSQRPSELSKTILSQCNTFIVHKLQNPEDQRYIKQVVSSANEDLLNQLAILPQQHAVIMGEAVRTPMQIKINDIKEENRPDSNNPKFIEKWLEESCINIDKVASVWQGCEETDEVEKTQMEIEPIF